MRVILALHLLSWTFLHTRLTLIRKTVPVSTMPDANKRIYFDTDVFHRIGKAFANQGLADDLRERTTLAPITVLEALSHLTLKNNDFILTQLQAIHNWVNPKHANLLNWPSEGIARIGFQLDPKPDDFVGRIEKTINRILASNSAEEFRESADKLKNEMDKIKDTSAEQFQRLVEMQREKPLNEDQFSEVWAAGIARRVGANADARPISDVVAALSAYHEYEESRLREAASNPKYNPDKNDILDAEQLIYLGSPELRFLTCDGGYLNRVKKSPQRAQIRRATLDELSTPEKIEALLREIVA